MKSPEQQETVNTETGEITEPKSVEQMRHEVAAIDRPTGLEALFNFSNPQAAFEMAEYIAKSQLIPQAYQGKPSDVLVAWAFGMEVGLPPMAALRYVAVVNGRPSIYSDGSVAIMMRHPDFVDMVERYDEETDTAYCTVKRRGRTDVTQHFSDEDRKKAKLGNVHNSYPRRMLQWRARHLAMRDQFPDAFSGLFMESEARDMAPPEVDITDRGETLAREAPPEPQPNKSRAKRIMDSAAGDAAVAGDISSPSEPSGDASPAPSSQAPAEETVATPDGDATPAASSPEGSEPRFSVEEIFKQIDGAKNKQDVFGAMDLIREIENGDDRASLSQAANAKLEKLEGK